MIARAGAPRLSEAQKRSVPCPTCGASQGAACKSPGTLAVVTLKWTHDARRVEALLTHAPAPRTAMVFAYEGNIRHERGTVTLAPRTETGLKDCPGEAHTNAYIDHCMTCLGGTYGKVMGYAPLTLTACTAGFAVPVNETDRDAAFAEAEKAGEVVLVHVEAKIGRKSSCSFFAYVSATTAKGLAAIAAAPATWPRRCKGCGYDHAKAEDAKHSAAGFFCTWCGDNAPALAAYLPETASHSRVGGECGKPLPNGHRCVRVLDHMSPCSPVVFKGES